MFDFTGVDPLLRNLGVSRLIVAGLQANVCGEATARSGLAHGFEVAAPEDAVSTDGPALHFTTPDYGRDPAYWSEVPGTSGA